MADAASLVAPLRPSCRLRTRSSAGWSRAMRRRWGWRARRESAPEGCDLRKGERGAGFAVKGFNEGPLDAGYIDGEAMAATGVLRVGGKPRGELRSRGCGG